MSADLAPEERQLALALGILAVVFGLATLVFAFCAQPLVAAINRVSLFLLPASPPIPESPARFWLTLALSMMIMITYIGALGWYDVRGHIALIPVLLLSKLMSSALGVVFAVIDGCPAYVSIAVSDFPIFAVVLVLYVRARRAQRRQGIAT